ncbi:MAG: phosphocholine cytidylyltransferase family protein [Pseudomonadota bacterium]|nr:phosphocholine cytidylyltransferase family protein [Pseudomonadota bacterium]
MKAIILAAGRGARLNQLTENNPKCLVQLLGRTLLEWQIQSLRTSVVSQIGIVTGYRADMLAPYADRAFINSDWEQTNMVQSLVCASEWLENETCLVSYSDIVYHPSIVKQLMNSSGDIVISYDRLWLQLWEKRFENPLSDAESFIMNTNGKLIEIGKKTQNFSDIQGQYMGLLLINPSGWKKITQQLTQLDPIKRNKLDMTSLLNLLLQSGATINTVGVEGKWCEIDSKKDLSVCEQLLSTSGWSHDFRF